MLGFKVPPMHGAFDLMERLDKRLGHWRTRSMPVMELWRCDKPTQWPKADAEIGMDENRLPLVKYCETAIAASEKPSAKIGASEIPLNAICSTG